MAALAVLIGGAALTLVPTPSATAAEESLFTPATVPVMTLDPDPNAVELGVRFSVTTPGTVVGVKYYATPHNRGPHTGSLWSGSGKRLATAGFATSGRRGWRSVTFHEAVPVTPGNIYVASYLAPSGKYAADQWGFEEGLTRGHIVTRPGAGVYKYGRNGGFPTHRWRKSNYYVDVTFVPGPGAGQSPSPTVSQTAAPTPSPSPSGTPGSSPTPTRTTSPTPTATTSVTSLPSTTSTPTSTAPATSGGCAPKPSACGFPDETNTGVQRGIALTTHRGDLTISQDGTVLQNTVVYGSVDIAADNVTLRNVRIIANGDGWAIGLAHSVNATIDHVTIAPDPAQRRLWMGVHDIYGDASGTRILSSDIAGTSTGIQIQSGLMQDNYIHDMRMVAGDHVNGQTSNGSSVRLTIRHNTIFNQISQTDAISLFQDFGVEANRLVDDNLIAGGGYTFYGGAGSKGASHDIVVTDNRFARIYYPRGGSYGPVTAFDRNGVGNVWTGNVWDDTGTKVAP